MTMSVQSWNNSVAKHVVEAHNISSGQLLPTLLLSSRPETLEVVTFLSSGEKQSAPFFPTPSQTLQQVSGGVLPSANLTSWTALSRGTANTTPVFFFASSVEIPGIAGLSNISDGRTSASILGASIVPTLRPTTTIVTTTQNLSNIVRFSSSTRIISVTIHQAQALTLPSLTATALISNLLSPVATLLVPGSSNQTRAFTNTSGLATVSSTGNLPTGNTSRTTSTSAQTVYVASFSFSPVTVDTYQASFILLSGLHNATSSSSTIQSKTPAFAANVPKPSTLSISILSGDNATSGSFTVAPTSFTTSQTTILPIDSSVAAEPVFKETKAAPLTKQQTAGVAVAGATCLITALLIAVFFARRRWANKKRRGSTAHEYKELKGGGDDTEIGGTICANSLKAAAHTRHPRSGHISGYGDPVKNMKNQYAQMVIKRIVSVQHPSMFSDGCNDPFFTPYHSDLLPEILPPSSTHSTVPAQTQSQMSSSSHCGALILGNASPYHSNGSRTILAPTRPTSAQPIYIGWNDIKSDGHITGSDLLGSAPADGGCLFGSSSPSAKNLKSPIG